MTSDEKSDSIKQRIHQKIKKSSDKKERLNLEIE